MKKFTSYTRGFTLIELLVVIAIIGILASVVLVSLGSARGKSKEAAVQEQMAGLRAQMELFASSNSGSYSGGCAAAASSNGALGILTGAAGSNIIASQNATPVTAAGIAGAFGATTCHDSATVWAAETPFTGSATGASVMWCVDSTGKSAKAAANTNLAASGANQYACQ